MSADGSFDWRIRLDFRLHEFCDASVGVGCRRFLRNRWGHDLTPIKSPENLQFRRSYIGNLFVHSVRRSGLNQELFAMSRAKKSTAPQATKALLSLDHQLVLDCLFRRVLSRCRPRRTPMVITFTPKNLAIVTSPRRAEHWSE